MEWGLEFGVFVVTKIKWEKVLNLLLRHCRISYHRNHIVMNRNLSGRFCILTAIDLRYGTHKTLKGFWWGGGVFCCCTLKQQESEEILTYLCQFHPQLSNTRCACCLEEWHSLRRTGRRLKMRKGRARVGWEGLWKFPAKQMLHWWKRGEVPLPVLSSTSRSRSTDAFLPFKSH